METRFDHFVLEQNKALGLLYREELVMPFLMVSYATVDVLGFVASRNVNAKPADRFRGFVDQYMLRHLGGVNAHDLWGARCALLHTGTPDSALSEQKRARVILYSWGNADNVLAEKVIQKAAHPEKYVAVAVEELHGSIVAGLGDLAQECRIDSTLNRQCVERASRFYSDVRAR
jgi:hypothetical protein